jgi:hypothetical protein
VEEVSLCHVVEFQSEEPTPLCHVAQLQALEEAPPLSHVTQF